jgi:hypothetical protein
MATLADLPKHARAVIVGGGIIGTSIAYHLAKLGCQDVVLLERHQLTAGTTWHAAGLMVTYGSTSETSTELRKYTRDLYSRLEAETGQATGFMPIGFIEVAADADRLEEFRRVAAFNRYCGVDVQELSPRQVGELFYFGLFHGFITGFQQCPYLRVVGIHHEVIRFRECAEEAATAHFLLFHHTTDELRLSHDDRCIRFAPAFELDAEFLCVYGCFEQRLQLRFLLFGELRRQFAFFFDQLIERIGIHTGK